MQKSINSWKKTEINVLAPRNNLSKIRERTLHCTEKFCLEIYNSNFRGASVPYLFSFNMEKQNDHCCEFDIVCKNEWEPVVGNDTCVCARRGLLRDIQKEVSLVLEIEEREKAKSGSIFGSQKGLATFGSFEGKMRPRHLAGSLLVVIPSGHRVKVNFIPANGFSMPLMCWMWLSVFEEKDARFGNRLMNFSGKDHLELAQLMIVDRFVYLMEFVVAPNLRKGYKHVIQRIEASLRGIPRFDLAIRRGGDPSRAPLECFFSSLTFDLPENRLLKSACQVVHRIELSSEAGREDLERLRKRLADLESSLFVSVSNIEIVQAQQLMRSPLEFHRANEHYKQPVKLAHALLDGARFERNEGTCVGFLLTTYAVFEQYLHLRFQRALKFLQGDEKLLQGYVVDSNKATESFERWTCASKTFDLPSKQEPDFTIRKGTGESWDVLAVIDAKFSTFFSEVNMRKEKTGSFRDHRWQILTYMSHCSSKWKPFGALFYAKGQEFEQIEVFVAGKPVQRYAVRAVNFEDQATNWEGFEKHVDGICESIIKKALDYRKQQL